MWSASSSTSRLLRLVRGQVTQCVCNPCTFAPAHLPVQLSSLIRPVVVSLYWSDDYFHITLNCFRFFTSLSHLLLSRVLLSWTEFR